MNGWLVYCREDAAKNRPYIDMFFAQGERRGIAFSLLYLEELETLREEEKTVFLYQGNRLPLPDLAVNRSRSLGLSLALEGAGIRVFNNSTVTLIGNDKPAALTFAKHLGLPVLRTFPLAEDNPKEALGKLLSREKELVLKTIDGHGGSEVFWVKENGPWEELLSRFQGRSLIAQEPADTLGRDLRVYVTGGRILTAVLRKSDTDFRSNFSLGGSIEIHTLTDEERAMAEKMIQALAPDHCGVDFLYHKGHPVFSELEDVVGSRMLYTHTDIDAVDGYVDWISRSVL